MVKLVINSMIQHKKFRIKGGEPYQKQVPNKCTRIHSGKSKRGCSVGSSHFCYCIVTLFDALSSDAGFDVVFSRRYAVGGGRHGFIFSGS